MAGRLRHHAGGISGLQLDVLSDPERRRALQYDLLRDGLTLEDLGSEALTWYDLACYVQHAQTRHDSELAAVIVGYRPWSLEAQLAAMLIDATNVGNWQRAGNKNAPKPQPIERPWLKAQNTRLGKDPIPVADFDDWWDAQSAAKQESPLTD